MMKKSLSLFLSVLLTLSVCMLPVSAAQPVWNEKSKGFELTQGPDITRIVADSDENGTRAIAYFAATAEYQALADAWRKAFRDEDAMYADALGLNPENVDGDLEVYVQVAYSFNGVNWVNDWETDDPESDDYKYYAETEFDFDGDGFMEYRDLPCEDCNLDYLFEDVTIFDGRRSCLSPGYLDAEDDQIREKLTIRNNAILQGKGEFTGSAYVRDDENWSKGFMVDFNRHTLYAKARYRVYNRYQTQDAEGDWNEWKTTVAYSNWGAVKSFNNNTASLEKQDCVPSAAALKTNDAPKLTVLSHQRYDIERDGVPMKATKFALSVRYPADTQTSLSKFYALSGDERAELIDEYFKPSIYYEIRVGDGDWYVLTREDCGNTYYTFDDDIYWIRDELEALGYQSGDPVYLRAVLYGSDSYRTERDEKVDYDKLTDREKVNIKTARSNEIELSLTGKFNIRYELNGGGFPYDTKQIRQFDEDTLVNVDLTSGDYTPTQEHFVFKGWYTTKDFAKGTEIKAFDTAEKRSRTYYAKWEELPSYTLTYDFGVVTDYVYNPNRERIWTDDGEITIEDVDYGGAKFLGWYDAKVGGAKVTSLSYTAMKGNMTLYARWELPTKKIAYSGAGKDYINDASNPATYQINPTGSNTVILKAPEKRGHIFDGWYLNQDFKTGALNYDEQKGGWLLNESEDVTLYAKWILGRWNINYVLNIDGAWNGGNPDNYTYGNGILLQNPRRTGYNFDGWFADKDFKTAVTEIKGDDVGEKTLYAKWTPIRYTITYDLRDPQIVNYFNNANPASRTVDDEIRLQPLTPTSKLYKFLGWYDNVNYDGDVFAKIAAGTDHNVTVYAKLYKYIWGDTNFDGEVGVDDARKVLRCAVGLEELDADAAAWSDLDHPGATHEMEVADARIVLRMAVGLDTAVSLNLPEAPIL